MTFGEALKRARGDVSQKTLAEAIGIKQPSIAAVESGKRKTLSAKKVASIESFLGLKPGALAKHLPKDHRAHDLVGADIPDYGLVWGSPPRDVPEPVPGKVYHLVGRFPAGTFALQVSGHSIHRYGVYEGDVIAVQPSSDPEDGALVVARQGNAYTIKGCRDGRLYSFGKDDETPKELDVSEPFDVVGVMIGVIDGQRRFVPRSKTRGKPPGKK